MQGIFHADRASKGGGGGGACWVIQGIAGNQSTYSSLTYIALIFSGKLNYSCYREIKS